MKYQSVRDINFNGNIVPAGKVLQFEEKDAEFVQRLLGKGSIVELKEEETTEAPVATVTPPADTTTQVVPTVPTVNPTAEQIAQDLKAAGV